MLKIDNLHAYYGKSHVLHGVHFDVQPGEIVALLGRNGSGRSTTAKAIMGMVDWEGSVHWKGRKSWARRPTRLPTWALATCPKAATSFPQPDGAPEPAARAKGAARAAAGRLTTCTRCSRASRSASTPKPGVMSGGEQQMLTLCRTLMGDPDLIIIDEPTEGLAPKIVELVGEYLRKLKDRGISVLLIEQKLTIAMTISDRALVMGHGSIVFQGTPDSLRPTPTSARSGWR
jgi:branched-chain amino acid transport system ATP-binding protein